MMLNTYTTLIDQVATRMYESDEEYMYYSFETALPRIFEVIKTMTMQEMLDYIKEETTDADYQRLSKTINRNNALYFDWLRPRHPTVLTGMQS